MIVLCSTTWAQSFTFGVENDDGVMIYYLFKGEGSLTSLYVTADPDGSLYEGDIVIPAIVNYGGRMFVRYVDNEAFYGCSELTSVTLPEYMQEIGVVAFSGCSKLKSITLLNTTPPDCLTDNHGDNPFDDGLYGIYFNYDACTLYVPEGCVDTYREADIWKNFTNIKEIGDEEEGTPLEVGTKFDVDGIYYEVTSSEERTVDVTWGGESASSGTESYIGDITIPQTVVYDNVTYTVTRIGDSAFCSCYDLTSLIMPNTVTRVGDQAFFQDIALTKIDFSEKLDSIGMSAFWDCQKLENVEIPDGVTIIRTAAFTHCISFTEIVVPNSVLGLGSEVFEDCTNLQHATLSSSLGVINSSLFKNCVLLEEIVIPKNVGGINQGAFAGCTNLKSITSLNLTPPETYSAFSSIDKETCVLYVPESALENYASSVYEWREFINIVGIAEEHEGDTFEVDGIYYGIVSTDNKTVEVTWGNSSRNSGTESYVGEIDIPAEVEYGNNTYTVVGIGVNAFSNCGELTSITLPESVTYIEEYAFRNTSKLTTVTIGSGVTTIKAGAFYASGLTEVTIPASVVTMGDYMFAYSANLEKATIENEETGVGEFQYCTSLKDVDLGHVTHLATRTFQYCEGLEYITIPETVTDIDAYVFYYCTKLKEITIPDNVTYMAGWVVWTCTSLEKAVVGNGVSFLAQYQFCHCSNLKELTFGSSIEELTTGVCRDCTSLETLYSLNPEPPTCGEFEVFEGVPTSTCVLYVPQGSRNAYASAYKWREFLNIKEIGDEDDTDGINGISADGADIEGYYSTGGQKLNAPQKGVNIIRYNDGTVKKIFVK